MSISKLTTNGLTGSKYDTVSADNYYMEPIATQLLASTAGSVTFSNIPQNYKHLQLRVFAQTNYSYPGSDGLLVTINNDTTTTYRHHQMFGQGATVTANNTSSTDGFYINRFGNTSNGHWGACITDILDYANTNKYKTARSLGGVEWNGSIEGAVYYSSGLYPNTSPITTIKISSFSPAVLSVNSRISLYGLKG